MKTISSIYNELKPATTLRELFEQFEKVIKIPQSISDEVVEYSKTTGKPVKTVKKNNFATSLNLSKTKDVNGVDWGTTPALKATNKVYDLLNVPFLVMDSKYYRVEHTTDDGYTTCYISRIRPLVVK